MEDDTEVLDWGHEEELGVAVHGSDRRQLDIDDDVEDAVSLGGDEEDEFLTYQSRVPQDTSHRAHSPPQNTHQPRQDSQRPRSNSPSQSQEEPAEHTGPGDQSSFSSRTPAIGPLVHALPPKPVVSSVPFVHPSHPSIIEATAMASRADRDKRNGAGSKPNDYNDSLPPGWEVKYPRNRRGVYYYNIHTQESTWTRPTFSTREKRAERSDHRDDPLDKPLSTRNDEALIPRVGRTEGSDMSYGDRHYRPGEAGRREERPSRSSQLIDSYVPDSYSPNHRNSRASPPSPRGRERDLTSPPRRLPSPGGTYGDRDGVQNSHREPSSVVVPSAQDRVRVAHDDASLERTRERRYRDDPPPLESERRNLPRDTERSSTLRPRSPASRTRGSQESANTTPRSSANPSQPISEAPPTGRKSRFSQADPLVQHGHRHFETRDIGMRRSRTDGVSYGTRPIDDAPSSRSMSDVRGDDDIPTYPASDSQRPGSRKRPSLPPQDETFTPGVRWAPAQRGGPYLSGPAGSAPSSIPENRHTSRIASYDTPRNLARRSPSPPPQSRAPIERGDHDRGRFRWSRLQDRSSQMDSRNMHESSRGRAHDTAMDVDDAHLPRSSDPPTKQIALRRPALQDEVPRYPRAMLNSDNDGPSRGIREARDGMDVRHRSTIEGHSRFGPSRDRPGTERQSVDQGTSQRELNRNVDIRASPSGSNLKLSGTSTPVGAKGKLGGNVLPPPMPPSSAFRTSWATEPVAPRRDCINRDHERTPHFDGSASDRAPTESAGREDVLRSPANNSRALPPVEPAGPPARPSRAALGISRFGPPIVKENTEPVRLPVNVSSESLPIEHITEGSLHATPPPPSRESSMASFKDVTTLPGRLSHLPPRPTSPPDGHQFHSGDVSKPLENLTSQSPTSQDKEMNVEVPARPRLLSPAHRKSAMDTYSSDPLPAARENRPAHSPEHSRTNLHELETDHAVTRPPSVLAVQDEDQDRAPPPMHPERALMLQVNGLPPRPPSGLGRALPGRGFKRDRPDDRSHDRVEPLRGNNRGAFDSASSGGERRRYPKYDFEESRPPVVHGSGGGGSLLDRLTMDEGVRVNSPSLRDRVQLPSKRVREEMITPDLSFELEGDDYDGSKRIRRRGGPRMRRGKC